MTRTGCGGKEEVKRESLVRARVTRGHGEGMMDGGWCHVGLHTSHCPVTPATYPSSLAISLCVCVCVCVCLGGVGGGGERGEVL